MRGVQGGGPDPLSALEREPLCPYYLLHGDEIFLVERALGVLRRRIAGAGTPGAWRVVWGDDAGDKLAAALEDLRSPSLFGGSATVVVRRAEALKDDDQERVLSALPGLSCGALVLVARMADQRRKLVAACTRAGAAYGFPPVDARTAQTWVGRMAREQGGDMTPGAAQELVERSGTDLGALAGEVAKLVLFAGAGTRIEAQHVRALVAAVRGHAVEELADRLARRDVRGATAALRALLADGEPPLRLLGFLAANVRRSLHVAELAEQGLTADEIATRLGMPPWLVGKIAGRGRAADLGRALLTLRRLDLELKSTRPAEATFEAALLEIAGA